jgi:putative cardiolipin synthase
MTLPVATLLRRWALTGLVQLAALAAGCAGLPAAPPQIMSEVPAPVPHDAPLLQLAQASLDSDGGDETAESSGLRLLSAGDEALAARLALIERARHRIDAQYYLIAADRSGRAFVRALRDAAARGVQVRLLVDDLHVADIEPQLAELDRTPNAEVRLFNPLPARRGSPATRLVFSLHEFERVNRRMHNKLLLVDQALAVTGGRNIGDMYFEVDDDSHFVDMDVLAAGAVVAGLASVFDDFWRSDSSWPLQVLLPSAESHRTADEPDAHGVDVRPGKSSVVQEIGAGRLQLHVARARVLADRAERARRGVPAGRDDGALYDALGAMLLARQEIVIASPYFIPGRKGMGMVKAVTGRGVRVRLLTNSVAGTDEPFAYWRYAQYRPELLELGVELHELSPQLAAQTRPTRGAPGSSAVRLHGKLAVVDRERVLIGSMNMDPRSARLNTEVGLLIDSPSLAAEVLAWSEREALPGALRVRLDDARRAPHWVAIHDLRLTVHDSEPELDPGEWLRLTLLSWFVDEELL